MCLSSDISVGKEKKEYVFNYSSLFLITWQMEQTAKLILFYLPTNTHVDLLATGREKLLVGGSTCLNVYSIKLSIDITVTRLNQYIVH